MRVVRTRVFPLPAPARMRADWRGSVTAFSCSGLRFSRRRDMERHDNYFMPRGPRRRRIAKSAIGIPQRKSRAGYARAALAICSSVVLRAVDLEIAPAVRTGHAGRSAEHFVQHPRVVELEALERRPARNPKRRQGRCQLFTAHEASKQALARPDR